MKVALIAKFGTRWFLFSETLVRKRIYGSWYQKERSSFISTTDRIDHLYQDPHDPKQRFGLHYGDLIGCNKFDTHYSSSLMKFIAWAMSHVLLLRTSQLSWVTLMDWEL